MKLAFEKGLRAFALPLWLLGSAGLETHSFELPGQEAFSSLLTIIPALGVLHLGSSQSRTTEELEVTESSDSLSGSEKRISDQKRHQSTWVNQSDFWQPVLGYFSQTCHTEKSACAQHRWMASGKQLVWVKT